MSNIQKDQSDTLDIKSNELCPYCNAKAFPFFSAQDLNRHLTDKVFSYSQCQDCNLVFMNDIPSEMSAYYTGGYQTIPASLSELRVLAIKEKYRLEPILRYKSSGKLLELGPWIGIFSCNAKDAGFEVTAIDMSVDCVNFLQNELQIDAIQTNEPASVLSKMKERFDVVVLWHCLEHFPRPWEVVQQASRVLKPGGLLLLAIPNIESYEFKVLKSKWTHVDAPRHLHFYPLNALTALCEENGLRCIEATTADHLSQLLRRSSWYTWGKNLVPWSGAIGRILGMLFGLLIPFFIRYRGESEGSGAGLTAVYVKDN